MVRLWVDRTSALLSIDVNTLALIHDALRSTLTGEDAAFTPRQRDAASEAMTLIERSIFARAGALDKGFDHVRVENGATTFGRKETVGV